MIPTRTICSSILSTWLVLAAVVPAIAWQPGDAGRVAQAGGFPAYLTELDAWLKARTPRDAAALNRQALARLLEDPLFRNALNQRQLVAKTGAAALDDFVKASPAQRGFLTDLLQDTAAMDLYLEAAVPTKIASREANSYALPVRALEIWCRIQASDPESKAGIYQKLAIATAIAPPGSVNIGAGGAATPADPVTRYHYYKNAHRAKQLFPSFDNLTAWEYSKVVVSGASDDDLTWAREMVNTWRPDLRKDEMVVNSTSFVWRRNSPIPFNNTFKNVMAGGGKCGPRSSWAVMVCHAFGIPAIGVGQPAHACVAYKAANPRLEPQPGSIWKVGYGRGWEVSKLEDMSGPEFLAGVAERMRAGEFSLVEHSRWLAAAMDDDPRAGAIMDVAKAIRAAAPPKPSDLTASLKPEEANADPGGKAPDPSAAPKDGGAGSNNKPLPPRDGIFHVEAASFARTGGEISWGGQQPHVLVHDCFTGGKQVFFQQQMKSQWADYQLDVPHSGNYQITLKAAVVNSDQLLELCVHDKVIATLPIPLSYGLWQETQPVTIALEKGVQTLRIQTPTTEHKRGIALRSFVIRPR